MRDKNFQPASGKLSRTYYHFVFWVIFILYEVILAAAIRERFNHIADYTLHYSLNILLFYVHCYVVLGKVKSDEFKDYKKILLYFLLEICGYYLISLMISKILITSGIPVNVSDTSSKLFHFSMLYRFIYIIGLASAFRVALNLLENKERVHQFIIHNLRIEKEKAALRTELITSKLSVLRSQVNPHFLFNSLNSIYNRIRRKDPKSAEYVIALADLMRYALQPENDADEVPVEYELEHILNYLKLQRMRYSVDLDVNIAVEEKYLKIAPFLLINIIENIFKHGDLKYPKCRPLILIHVSKGELILTTKNYIRHDHSPGNGIGLTNIRSRLEYQYKDRFEFEYSAIRNVFKLKLLLKLI